MKKYNYIYLITNKTNGKIYIGKHSTNKLDDGYMGSGKLIKMSILKYGLENFTKDYLAFCDTEETLNYLEKFYIKKYKAKEVGYNLTDGGDGHCGYITSESTKQKIRDALLGKPISDAHKQKLREKNLGKKHSSETKEKMSLSHKGMVFSDTHKEHLSMVRKGKASESHRTETTKQKISKSMKGSFKSDTHKEHMKKPKQKYKWITNTGEIIEMSINHVKRYHQDWIKIGEA